MLILAAIFFIQSTSMTGMDGASGKKPADEALVLEGGKTIAVTSIEFSGNKSVSTAELKKLTMPFLNRSLSTSDLDALKQRIQFYYQTSGHPEPKVTIPAKQQGKTLTVIIKEDQKKKMGS